MALLANIDELLEKLRELSATSQSTTVDLQEFNKFLDTFGGTGGAALFSDFTTMISSIEKFSASLRELGLTAPVIADVRRQLIALGSARLTASDIRRLAPARGVGTTPEVLAQERLSELIRTLGITERTPAENPEYFNRAIANLGAHLASFKTAARAVPESRLQAVQARLQGLVQDLQGPLEDLALKRQTLGGDIWGAMRRGDIGEVTALREQLEILRDQAKALREKETAIKNVATQAEEALTALREQQETANRVAKEPGAISARDLGIPPGQPGEPEKQLGIDLEDLEQAGIKTEQLQKKMAQLGLTTANLVQRPVTELSTGITRLTFESTKSSGVIQRFTTHIDRAGNVLGDTQKRFRTFGDAIVRDTIEVLKWTIAIGLVYGPMRKLNELIKQASEIQSSLVDVQIVLGRSTDRLGEVFKSAQEIANQTSSSISGVIEGYNEALSATGRITDQAERLASANVLLRDSMILAKLAGIDQAKALDTLVGAIGQSDLALTQGVKFLDSWVAVSKNANVTLNQLASTFAIVGVAAEDAGIDFDELNAIVATLAENTKLSADEVGNAVRGFISGFQSATAEETLSRFGIAVRNVQGQVRSFTDVMRELAVLSQQGAISSRDVAEIANAVGGGFRRGAQFATLLESYPRVLQLIAVSQNAAGDSADALEIKMSTLESSITRLQNAFAGLAQSLGGEGGALSGLTKVTDIITGLVQIVTELINVLGPAAPLLATVGLGGAVLRTGTGQRYLSNTIPAFLAARFATPLQQTATATARLSTEGGGQYASLGMNVGAGGIVSRTTYSQFFSRLTTVLNERYQAFFDKLAAFLPSFAGRGVSRIGAVGAQTLLGPGIIAGTKLLQGEATSAGFAIAGGILGALTGSPLLATAGSVIAVGFYEKFLSFTGDISDRWAERFAEAQAKEALAEAKDTGTTDTRPPEEIQRELDDLFRQSLSWAEAFSINATQFFFNLPGELGAKQRAVVPTTYWEQLFGPGTTAENVGKVEGIDIADLFRLGAFPPGFLQLDLDEESLQLLQDAFNNRINQAIKEGIISTREVEKKIDVNIEAVRGLAGQTASDLVQKALEEITKGSTGAIQSYIDAQQIASELANAVGKFLTAVEFTRQAGVQFPAVTQQQAVEVYAGLSKDERSVLAQFSTDITSLQDNIQTLLEQPVSERADTWATDIEDLNKQLNESAKGFAEIWKAISQGVIAQQAAEKIGQEISLPELLTDAQVQEAASEAERLWREYLEAWGLSDDEIEALINNTEEQLVYAGNRLTEITSNVPQKFFNQALQNLNLGGQFNIMDLRNRLTQSQLPGFIERYAQIVTAVKKFFPQFNIETEPLGIIMKDGFATLDVNTTLLNLALQDLIDIEKEKGIEGIYNLPEGATFYVPVSAFELDQSTRARAGGAGSYLGSSVFDQFAKDPEALKALLKLAGIDVDAATGGTEKILGTSVDVLREIAQNQINDIQKREELGVTGVAKYLPAEDIKDILKEKGLYKEPKPAETLDVERNSLLGTIKGQIDTFTSGQQTLVQTVNNIYTLLAGSKDILGLNQAQKEGGESSLNVPKLIPEIPATPIPEGPQSSILPRLSPVAFEPTQPQEPLSTRLNLSLESTTTITLDGRVIANVIKPYLYEDLLRYQSTGTATIKRNILA